MALDLFAGIPVSDHAEALAWYGSLLGSPPSFLPNDVEAVWQVTEHGYVYIVERADGAGHALHTLFVDDLDARLAATAGRGLEPSRVETYENGVRKATFVDPDGNEIALGGAPLSAPV